jgi:hypothetical protein
VYQRFWIIIACELDEAHSPSPRCKPSREFCCALVSENPSMNHFAGFWQAKILGPYKTILFTLVLKNYSGVFMPIP